MTDINGAIALVHARADVGEAASLSQATFLTEMSVGGDGQAIVYRRAEIGAGNLAVVATTHPEIHRTLHAAFSVQDLSDAEQAIESLQNPTVSIHDTLHTLDTFADLYMNRDDEVRERQIGAMLARSVFMRKDMQ